MNILSIQSWVAYGHVGNAAAIFPLQRLGAEVWAINTVQFSNHPGYGAWRGQVATGAMVAELVDGIAERGVLGTCDAVLSGYMGDAGVGEAILGAVARVRAANPAALYCCDPVMGDAGALYVRAGIPELIAERAVPLADILTPNQFELETLTGAPCRSVAEVRRAIGQLRARMSPQGPRIVLITSLDTEQTPDGALDMVAADAEGCWRLRTPRLPIAPSGAGDAVAALFLFHVLRSGRAGEAMAAAGSALHAVLRRTVADGVRELQLIAAQDELVRPELGFRAEIF
ncbi:MAG: pyridoxal kinase [Acetobacteraceae bacterium]